MIHEKGYEYVIEQQKSILDKIIEEAYKYYCRIWNEYELDEYFTFINNKEGFIS